MGSPCSLGFYYLVFWLFKLAACGVTLFWALAGQMAACGVTLFWALAGQMAACGVTLFFRLPLLSILAVQTGCMWGHLVLGLGWTNVGSPCSLGFYYLVFWLFKLAAFGVTLFWTNVGSPCSGPWLNKWLHVGSPCSLGFYYRIARKFRGVKFSRISRICLRPRKF